MSRRWVAIAVLCWSGLLVCGSSQTLARRPAASTATAAETAPASTDARLALPAAAEGEYRWGESGEVISLYVEAGGLRGYLTRRSERSDAGSAPMTFAFADARTSATRFSFTTRHIHGDWYSFEGSVVKVLSQKRRHGSEYLLSGVLTAHLAHLGDDDGPSGDHPLTRQISIPQSGSAKPEM